MKSADKGLACSILDDASSIAAEAASWNRIATHGHGGHPFLTADWFLLWLAHFAPPGRSTRFVKVTQRGEPVAYFPFVLATETMFGAPVPTLQLAGNIYSPITCPVVAEGLRLDVFDFVVREALPELPWTVLIADELPSEHVGPAELHVALSSAGYRSYLSAGEGNWLYSNPGVTGQVYQAERDSALRKSARVGLTRLSSRGRVELRVVGDAVTDADIRAYQEVYARSWKEPEIDPTFHPALMRMAARRGWLRLFFLELDGRPVATQLWLVSHRRAFALKFAYDEAFEAFSPGKLTSWLALAHLFDVDRVGSVDFLRGDDPYKKQWSNQRRQRLSLRAYSQTAAGEALRLTAQELQPWARRQEVLRAARRHAAVGVAFARSLLR